MVRKGKMVSICCIGARYVEGQHCVVSLSTLTITCALGERDSDDQKVQDLSNPEFLADGTATKDLLNPD
ncbi:UDP-glucose 6-dehydrogenase [Medicago truncatula]|uniref:UDP-glucose 6-dehydrogenase n=1 Tax=Medicago truncatula TaxID=3880 RepID=G7KMP2_MEDTR|nr:UDP-glucose 6-dehydrogenase [Medicago truncatula]